VKEKPTVGSVFFGAFPSDRIHKEANDARVHFFIHSSDSCKLSQRISGNFVATTHQVPFIITDKALCRIPYNV